MNACTTIDLATWPRREHYEFYRGFDDPCFNVTVKVRGDAAYRYAKQHGESFFLLCLYAILQAANEVPQLRRRVPDGQPVEYEHIAVSTPIMTTTGLFRQIRCEYFDTFDAFKTASAPQVEAAKSGAPAPLDHPGQDFLCASCLPWLHFESITQADLKFDQTVPILAWGKLQDGLIPVSVKCNHCFVDGLNVAQFFSALQAALDHPGQ